MASLVNFVCFHLLYATILKKQEDINNLRLRDTVQRSITHEKIHFTTKHVCCMHMLASYLTAVQISHLLKPYVHFVNRNNVILSTSQPSLLGTRNCLESLCTDLLTSSLDFNPLYTRFNSTKFLPTSMHSESMQRIKRTRKHGISMVLKLVSIE